ncbi:phage major capsid protein [Ligilactobacillus agilis]|uniref:phage major capsid protein n=1 Tax=Ligilactobacillus agilis TaxID=1601 RepID=UPI0018690153|nr:phage major capsid protein [Ligilactobacillus agilis]
MGINLNKLANFKAKQEIYAQLVRNGGSAEEQGKAFEEMMNAFSMDATDYIDNTIKASVEGMKAPVTDALTNEEREFFNALSNGDLSHKTSQEVVFPETTVDKIFEDMIKEHPLLDLIGLQNTGLRLKFLRSDAKGMAQWGKISGDIKGQLTGTFSDEDATQSKLTAFIAIPNDVLEYGATWIATFVTTQIQEAFAAALESAFITGDGNDKPIGLNRQVQEGVSISGGVYPEKDSAGTLTFKDKATAIAELSGVIKSLSVKENGTPFVAKGKTVLVMQPGASMDLEAANTMQNINGEWVYALPFGITVVESEYVPDGKVIAFVPDRYDAYTAGDITIKQFDQTLALEDGQLFTAKRFVYGKAQDDNTAKVYDLSIANVGKSAATSRTSSR